MPKRSRNPRSTNYIIKKTAEEYATSSSAHGISYISEHQRLPIERCFWIFVVILALLFRYIKSYCKDISFIYAFSGIRNQFL